MKEKILVRTGSLVIDKPGDCAVYGPREAVEATDLEILGAARVADLLAATTLIRSTDAFESGLFGFETGKLKDGVQFDEPLDEADRKGMIERRLGVIEHGAASLKMTQIMEQTSTAAKAREMAK